VTRDGSPSRKIGADDKGSGDVGKDAKKPRRTKSGAGFYDGNLFLGYFFGAAGAAPF
jgi:hypothetical protein